jgi:hypothetical protein
MSKDRTEVNDLAATMLERFKILAAKYDDWAKLANVKPWPLKPPKKK